MIVRAIIGICKNAGKTTVLNAHLLNNEQRYALTSVGIDGESKDQFFDHAKPNIFVKENTIIATSINSLQKSDITYEVLHITNAMTPLGYIAIINTLSAGYVEISGTSLPKDIIYISDWIKCNTDVDILYIDGALSRKQFSSLSFIDEVDIVFGASFSSSINTTLEEAEIWYKLYNLKQYDVTLPNKYNVLINDKPYYYEFIDTSILGEIIDEQTNFIYLNCIVTTDVFNYILTVSKKQKIVLVVENPNKLFVTLNDLNLIKNSNVELFVRSTLNISGVYINPYGYGYHYNQAEFKSGVENIFKRKVVDVGDKNEN